MENFFDLIVLGAGSGGLAAAKRAASYGARVAIVEGSRVGGTCVIRGCVPKKLLVYGSLYGEYIKDAESFGVTFSKVVIDSTVLLENIRKEVDRLNQLHIEFLSKAGVELFEGWAEFRGPNSILIKGLDNNHEQKEIRGRHILIAVGGKPIRPEIEGSSLAWVSDDMFLLKRFPPDVVIVGGGFIACEFASILNSLGTKVTQIVRGTKLLKGFDSELSNVLRDEMQAKGINFKFGESILGIEGKANDLRIFTSNSHSLKCSGLLFAIGRTPVITNLGLDRAGVIYTKDKIEVDAKNKTNIPSIFAIGDVTNRINLTPVAIDEGRKFSDWLFGDKQDSVNYNLVPKAVFSQPEIASVGLTEEEAMEKFGKDGLKIFRTRFRPMSQALPKRGSRCLLKLIVEKKGQKVIGCHMLGEHSSEIIQMASIALVKGATKLDFDKTMALHPTISEEFVTLK